MSTHSDATLNSIALVERLVLEDTIGARAVCQQVQPQELTVMVQCLATVLAQLLVRDHGVVSAVEQIEAWRIAAYAGAEAGGPDA